jgi:hypothetical protein
MIDKSSKFTFFCRPTFSDSSNPYQFTTVNPYQFTIVNPYQFTIVNPYQFTSVLDWDVLVRMHFSVEAAAVYRDILFLCFEKRSSLSTSTLALYVVVNRRIWLLLWCYDFLNIFAKNSAKKLAFLTQNKGKLCKILIIKLIFEKNANFFAENCRKSQKIVIITSTPGHPAWKRSSKKLVWKKAKLRLRLWIQGMDVHFHFLAGVNSPFFASFISFYLLWPCSCSDDWP